MNPFNRWMILIVAGALLLVGCKDSSPSDPSDRQGMGAKDGTSSKQTPAAGVLSDASPDERSERDNGGTHNPQQAWPQDHVGRATIRGLVTLEGRRPQPRPLHMQGDPACQARKSALYPPGMMISKGGGVPYVFVYIKKGINGSYSVPTDPVILNQTRCMFEPHVFGLQLGQQLRIINSDSTAHNVHCLGKHNSRFNISQPQKGMSTTKTFSRREVMIKFKCDVHGWMNAYLGVVPHPFYTVTDANGAFTLPRLPAGNYVIESWHELWGTLRQEVSVSDAEIREVRFIYSRKRASTKSP